MILKGQEHCPACGGKLVEKELPGEGLIPWCPACGQYRFPAYSVAVSMITVCETTGRVLLIKQYGRDAYILVAGYVNRGESVEHAVAREIREETGMTVTRARFNRTSFFEPSNTLMCNFTAYIRDESELKTNEEIDACAWFTPEEAREKIKPGSLAERFLAAWAEERQAAPGEGPQA